MDERDAERGAKEGTFQRIPWRHNVAWREGCKCSSSRSMVERQDLGFIWSPLEAPDGLVVGGCVLSWCGMMWCVRGCGLKVEWRSRDQH